jgi:hypothetical protein
MHKMVGISTAFRAETFAMLRGFSATESRKKFDDDLTTQTSFALAEHCNIRTQNKKALRYGAPFLPLQACGLDQGQVLSMMK